MMMWMLQQRIRIIVSRLTMGKKFNKKKSKSIRQDRNANQNRQQNADQSQNGGYEILERQNKNFEQYYEVQKFVPLNEWKDFLHCLKDDLPVAFRFTGFKTHVEALKKILNQLSSEALKEESEKKLQIHPLPWYPDNLGWQLNLTRKEVRRVESFKKLHTFLMSETEAGNISRQEAVSMIPPLILDIQPSHKVLDMCAAPGSKTAQIIEFLHQGSASSVPSGIVVANDADNRRCYMLTHQAKRLQSPTLMITNHDATLLPNIHYKNEDVLQPLKFDRVLCDVPCSGDGTLRKNYDVWSKWNAVNGANLHGLQFRIVRRGLELLEVGGRLVYSTCSLNPIENEAVVNRLLQEFESCIELVDVKDDLPGLKIVNGLEEWIVLNRTLDIIKSPEEIPAESLNYIHKLMFPPSPEEKIKRNLSRCIRILPHHQNTGGFFVAVLTKLKPLPGERIFEKQESQHQPCTTTATISSTTKPDNIYRRPRKRRCRGYKEEPFYYFENDRPDWKMLQDYYGISSDLDGSSFLTRTNDGKGKNIYFTNAFIKDIMIHNEDRIKVINTGVKVFVKCENKGAACHYRLSQEGATVLLPYISKRKLNFKKEDLLALLLNDDSEFPPQISSLHEDTQKECLTLDCGSVLFIYEDEDSSEQFPLSLCLVGWKGKNSVRCYVAKNERSHFLRLLGYDMQNIKPEG